MPRRGRVLPHSFYDRETEIVARELLGTVLECETEDGVVSGIIVETEAYLGEHDLACHAAKGKIEFMVQKNISDIHLKANSAPLIRLNGRLISSGQAPFAAEQEFFDNFSLWEKGKADAEKKAPEKKP